VTSNEGDEKIKYLTKLGRKRRYEVWVVGTTEQTPLRLGGGDAFGLGTRGQGLEVNLVALSRTGSSMTRRGLYVTFGERKNG